MSVFRDQVSLQVHTVGNDTSLSADEVLSENVYDLFLSLSICLSLLIFLVYLICVLTRNKLTAAISGHDFSSRVCLI